MGREGKIKILTILRGGGKALPINIGYALLEAYEN